MPRTKQFNREEILEKALEIFWRKGFHATSMQDLVNFLGINRASLYDTFGGKKKLFLECIAKYRANNQTKLDDMLGREIPAKEFLDSFLKNAIDESISDEHQKSEERIELV